MRTHDMHEQISLNVTKNLQNISIRYENNKALPRWDYANNSEAYAAIVEAVKSLSSEESNIRTIVIEGAASPVGNEEYNNRLALQRAEALSDIIAEMEGGDKLNIYVISAGEDWRTFNSHIKKSYHEPNREQVIAIIDSDMANDHKERQLQQLNGGKTWQILIRDFMDTARNAAMIHIVEIDDLAPKSPPLKFESTLMALNPDNLQENIKGGGIGFAPKINSEPAPESAPATEPKPEPKPEPESKLEPKSALNPAPESAPESVGLRKPLFALRSNLLVPALNVGIEVPIGNHWSVAADYYYPWIWPKRDNKNCFELLAWGIEGRYWFGRNRTLFNRLQGHSVGVYGYVGYYDFERNYHGSQGEFLNVGVDYTYAMAVGKRKQIHLEFSLGFGYIYSQARKYTVIEAQGPLISDKITKKVGFFGPTKANVSLVVPIFQRVKPNDKQRGNE